jgi:glycosyltransferase involved in cell wall biosynthesis
VPKLTATVITRNEAAHIEACLGSLVWADEVLVVDCGSTDGTPDLARARGARVVVRDWPGYSAQKNFAAGEAANDWILSVDADERVTPGLAAELQTLLAGQPDAAGYRLPRVTWHLGRGIRTTDWYPDPQLRLYDRRRATWQAKRVHESVAMNDGHAPGRLAHDLEHYAYRDIGHHHETMDRYTTLAAEEMYAAGRRVGWTDLVIHPQAAFLRNYVLRRGFLDGLPGLIISAMNAHYVFLKFAKLWALGQRAAPSSGPPPGRTRG